jgi:hypothetical protein
LFEELFDELELEDEEETGLDSMVGAFLESICCAVSQPCRE